MVTIQDAKSVSADLADWFNPVFIFIFGSAARKRLQNGSPFLDSFFRVVRAFRGNVFSWHRWQDVRFKAKELNHERHEIHEKV